MKSRRSRVQSVLGMGGAARTSERLDAGARVRGGAERPRVGRLRALHHVEDPPQHRAGQSPVRHLRHEQPDPQPGRRQTDTYQQMTPRKRQMHDFIGLERLKKHGSQEEVVVLQLQLLQRQGVGLRAPSSTHVLGPVAESQNLDQRGGEGKHTHHLLTGTGLGLHVRVELLERELGEQRDQVLLTEQQPAAVRVLVLDREKKCIGG
ncbi:hypothetical protein EYF80_051253 [Liparis tanakae]|uniref:Uncharacterized protein n=1 Tax=Liparis tanakae TaxID=230148 RepID=A0A4Z2FCH8_9TELE|nr:hypothetical protein EYF80_051253 [Liparis tanakae]